MTKTSELVAIDPITLEEIELLASGSFDRMSERMSEILRDLEEQDEWMCLRVQPAS